MKRLAIILFAVPVILVLLFVIGRMQWEFSQPLVRTDDVPELVSSNVVAATLPGAPARTLGDSNTLLGETILRGYADANFPPENDLTLMSRLMDNSLLLLKSAANRPLSANEDWADLFRGKNAASEEFLSAQHVALNDKGQLVDRWQTPLFFHALGGGRNELRSAGPDKRLWTADDIHRNADGSFRRGADLESSSLLESSARRR